MIGNNGTCFPRGTEVLAWVKAKAPDLAKSTDFVTVIFGTMGVGRVLDHGEALALRKIFD